MSQEQDQNQEHPQQPHSTSGLSETNELEKIFKDALTLHQGGQLGDARRLYLAVLEHLPNHAGCLHLLGLVAYQSSEFEEAACLISSAIAQNPAEAKFYADRGVAYRKLKSFDLALQDYERAQELAPSFAQVHVYKANLYKEMGDLVNAAKSFEQACLINPQDAKTRFSLGNVEQTLGFHGKASKSYEMAAALEPTFADAYNNWGVSLRALKELDKAVLCFEKAIALNPNSHAPHNNLGLTYHDMRRFDSAIESYKKAVAIYPDYFAAHNNLGQACISMGQYQRATEYLTQALQIQNAPEAYTNRANAYASLFEFEKALEDLQSALSLDPEFRLAHVNRSMLRLLLGQFEAGWPEYEWRLQSSSTLNKAHLLGKMRWLGTESLQGKTILLIREQGFGDTLQFCRYAQKVNSLGARVLLEVQKPLHGLLSRLTGADAVYADGEVAEPFDYFCPLLSLPLAFGTNESSITSINPGINLGINSISPAYLHADKEALGKWREILGKQTCKRIGLVFSGSPTHLNDANRSIEAKHLIASLPAGLEYICLQRELRDEDEKTLEGAGVKFFGEQIENFADTAALAQLMDLVISVDTSVAHLSGALGKPTWVLLPALPDWRWMLQSSTSPWYSSVKLYRQGKDRSWHSVLEKVVFDLKSEFGLEQSKASKAVQEDSFEHGLALHQNGQLAEAVKIYEQVLSQNSEHIQALHFLGVIAYQNQNPTLAVKLIGQAISIKPDYAEAQCHLGLSFQALELFDKALESFDKAISINPNFAQAHNNKGVVLQKLTRFEDSCESFRQAIRLEPKTAGPHFNLGNSLKQVAQLPQAIESYEKAIEMEPSYAQAYNNKGVVLKELGQLQRAAISFVRAYEIRPDYAEAFNNHGNTLKELGQHEDALESFEAAIKIRPDLAEAYNNKGFVLQELERFEQALACYDKAIRIKPDFAQAHGNRGNSLKKLSRFEEALACYERAISLKPDYAEAFYNMGVVNTELLRLLEASACYDKAISIDASSVIVYRNRAMVNLMLGQFEGGWQDYEWRWKQSDVLPKVRQFDKPLWLGKESLQNKTILIYAEQGLGDTIQFCRYAKSLAQLGCKVILEVPPSLMRLLQGLEGVFKLVSSESLPGESALPHFDFHCPIMSLPLAFKTDLSSIPSPTPYLKGLEEKKVQWRGKLGTKSKKRIGLVWSGSTGHGNDKSRSMGLRQMLEGLPAQFEYVSLQKEVREVDEPHLKQSDIQHFGAELEDFVDTAALCELMDVVICVDTSVAHLSGALGCKTFIVLPYVPDWRWLVGRSDSPWYESVKLFRQSSSRSWDSVLASLANDLLSHNG